MRKYLYLIKKKKIKSWLKFWLLTNNKFNIILSNIIEGTSFNLQNTVKRYFKIFNIFGNSVQDGTPSPSNPSEIHSVADDVNLLNVLEYKPAGTVEELNGLSFSYLNDGSIKVNGTASQNTSFLAFKKPDNPIEAGEYVFSGCTGGSYSTYRMEVMVTPSYSYLHSIDGDEAINLLTSQNLSHLYIIVLNGTTLNNKIFYPKFQKGTVATPYSPYNYGTFTIDFEGQTENYNYTFITKPLRSLLNGVRDTIEEEQHRKIEYLVFDGSDDEGWELWSGGTNTIGFKISNIANLKNIQSSSTENIVLSNYFKKKTNQDRLTGDDEEGFATAVGNLYFKINRTTVNSLAEWKIWLSTHNTEILYELAEEIIEPYTEEQQEQYNKIKELYTFNGTTNIYSDDEVPPYLQIQYYMKGE